MTHSGAEESQARLAQLRASIDNLDAAIVHLLAERFKCTQEVGLLKARIGMPPADPAREEQQIRRLRQLAEDASLDPVFAERFLSFIISEVVRHHAVLADEHAASQSAQEPQRRDEDVRPCAPPSAPADT